MTKRQLVACGTNLGSKKAKVCVLLAQAISGSVEEWLESYFVMSQESRITRPPFWDKGLRKRKVGRRSICCVMGYGDAGLLDSQYVGDEHGL